MSTIATEAKSSLSEVERMANTGETVTLKKLGEVTVKELAFEHVLKLSSELVDVAKTIDFKKDAKKGGIEWLKVILGNDQIFKAVRKLLAYSTGRKPEDFVNMGISDWMKLIAAFKRVTDWEEMQQLFTEVIPPEFWKKMREMRETKKSA